MLCSHASCPTHSGRLLLRLLRSVCQHCHRFKLHAMAVQRYAERVVLLSRGQLVEAESRGASAEGGKSADKARAELGNDLAGSDGDDDSAGGKTRKGARQQQALHPDEDRRRRSAAAACGTSRSTAGAGAGSATAQGGLVEEALKALRDEFFKSQPHTKCQNCGANSPQVRAMGASKLFVQPLKAKMRVANESQGVVIRSLLQHAQPDAEVSRKARGGGGRGSCEALLLC